MSDLTDQLKAILGYGRDVAQGASNAIAGNVSGPVDLISWGLRKAGLGNVIGDTPVGGSAWMAQKGLTPQPTNALAGMAGETLGMVGPTLAAAKAPQIANGLLQMGENLAKPSTLNPQMGAIVYHGSPHTFPPEPGYPLGRFRDDKIGTGEGAQAYGHGHYLAEQPETGMNYMNPGGPRPGTTPLKIDDTEASRWMQSPSRSPVEKRAADAIARNRNVDYALSYLEQDAARDPTAQAAIDWIKANDARINKPGNLYKVDLPDEHIAKMLDWDKPLSQQPQVLDAMKGTPLESLTRYADKMTGGDVVSQLGNNAQATAALKPLGIPGIKYLDQGSRAPRLLLDGQALPSGHLGDLVKEKFDLYGSADKVANSLRADVARGGYGSDVSRQAVDLIQGGRVKLHEPAGTSNYVVFDDTIPKILERNGQSLGDQLRDKLK